MAGASLPITSPIDGQVAYTARYLTPTEAFARLERAEETQASFKQTPPLQRAQLCRRFVECYEEHLEENAHAISQMMGKPLDQARAEFEGLKERTLAMCELAPRTLAEETVASPPGFLRSVRHEPLGVVLDIAAWNYPLLVATNIVVPAVLAGNSVLLKHAPQTALVGKQIERAFRAAGAPEDLVQDFFVSHDLAGLVIDSGRLGYLAFTGSVRGGKTVFARAGLKNLLRTGLELGGKDAAVVLPDADIERTAAQLVDGAFYNAGQSCCAVERIYVQRSIYEDFLSAFVAQTRKLKLGNPLEPGVTLGPVVHRTAAAQLRAQIAEARAQGTRLLLGPEDFEVPDFSDCYLAPHVFADATQELSLMREESFGPIVGIQSYEGQEEAIALVNDSNYGLTASIWTSDLERAADIGSRLDVGTVLANRADYVDPELPWSGRKDSGLGVSLSSHGLLALTRPKSFHFKKNL